MDSNAHLKWKRWKGGGECPVNPKGYVYIIYWGSAVPVGPLQAGVLTWDRQRGEDGRIAKYAEVHEIVHRVINA